MSAHDLDRVQPAAQPQTTIGFDVPAGASDCLTHIFGNPAQYPMSPSRTYTPPPASIAEIQAILGALHFTRVVIVQPTIYGTNNNCTLDAVRLLGAGARGVAVVDENTSEAELDEMQASGIRGIRINMETIGQADPAVARERFQAAMQRVKGRHRWHIQMYARPAIFEAIQDLIAACPVPVSLDHFAGLQAADGTHHSSFELLLEFLRAGKVYVKLSAPYLASKLTPDFTDIDPVARALIEANPERILWGTNWPHPNSGRGEPKRPFGAISPLRQPDDGQILNLLPRWAPDASIRRAILVDNPAALFEF
jgi:predicted TIM-barrel fold metal-dependent hydrolase